MKVAGTALQTLRKALLSGVFILTSCGPPQQQWADATNADRLARFQFECGYAVNLPTGQAELETLFSQHGTPTYVEPAGHPNTFPLEHDPEVAHGNVALAIVARCEEPRREVELRPEFGSRSARYAFYIDTAGLVFHVEDRSLYLG